VSLSTHLRGGPEAVLEGYRVVVLWCWKHMGNVLDFIPSEIKTGIESNKADLEKHS